MRHRSLIAGAVSALMALAPVAAEAQQTGYGPRPGVVHAKRVDVMDNQGFGQPLPAFSLLVPTHWQAEGGIVWNQSACSGSGLGFDIRFHAQSPDGAYGIGVVPQARWSANSAGHADPSGCPQVEIASVRGLIEAIVGRLEGGVRVIDFRARPDLAKGYEALNADHSSYGMRYRTWIEAGEALVAFDAGGRQMRGTVAVVATMWEVSMEGSYGMPGFRAVGGQSMPGYFAYAPEGSLDLALTEMIRKSIVPGPEWSRQIARHSAVIARQNREGAQARHRITMQANAEISEIISSGWAERQAIQDRGYRESIETIRGVETFHDPYNGGTVQLDSTFEHHWQLGDGTYVMTDDHFFEPFRDLGVDGQRLTPVP